MKNIENRPFFDEKGSCSASGLVISAVCVYYQEKSSSGVCSGDACSIHILLILLILKHANFLFHQRSVFSQYFHLSYKLNCNEL